MGLVASTRELSIADFLQVKGLSRSTCRILVEGRQGTGVLLLERGDVVYASYAEHVGERAAHAIVKEPSLDFRSSSDVPIPLRNMRVGTQALVMEAARRQDEDERALDVGRRDDAFEDPDPAAARREENRAGAIAAASHRPSSRGLRAPLVALACGAAAVVLGTAALVVARPSALRPRVAMADAGPVPPERSDPLEASVLVGPRDRLPALVAGNPPGIPDPSAALRPTVVCRLLVDARGAVVRAEVFQRRPDLARFEDAALEAARRFRFKPALRGGEPCAVWINWPVSFE